MDQKKAVEYLREIARKSRDDEVFLIELAAILEVQDEENWDRIIHTADSLGIISRYDEEGFGKCDGCGDLDFLCVGDCACGKDLCDSCYKRHRRDAESGQTCEGVD